MFLCVSASLFNLQSVQQTDAGNSQNTSEHKFLGGYNQKYLLDKPC